MVHQPLYLLSIIKFTVNKHQRHLSVKAQDYITYTPPLAHAVVLKIGGMLLVMNSLRGNAIWAICRGHIWYTSWIDRQSELCESYTQELIWCNFKLLQSVWGHHQYSQNTILS